MDHQTQREKIIHLCWTIGILVLILIAMVSFKIGAQTDLKDILSFAVSFASLILAIIAIGQALLSSNASTSTLQSVSEASRRLDQTSTEISKLSENLPITLNTLRGEIAGPVRVLSSSVEDLVAHTTELRGQQSRIMEQQENISTLMIASSSTKNTDGGDLGYFTNGQVVAILMCLKSLETKKSFEPDEVMKKNGGNYQSAVISTLRLAKVITVAEIDGKFRIDDMGVLTKSYAEFREYVLDDAPEVVRDAVSEIETFFEDSQGAAVPATTPVIDVPR